MGEPLVMDNRFFVVSLVLIGVCCLFGVVFVPYVLCYFYWFYVMEVR